MIMASGSTASRLHRSVTKPTRAALRDMLTGPADGPGEAQEGADER
jgi:hypothetical protein